MTQVPAVIRQYFEAINAEDWAALAGLYHDDAVIHPPAGKPVRGSAAIVSWYQAVFHRFPDHLDKPVRAIVSADGANVAVEIEFAGAARDGRAFKVSAVDHFALDGDRIRFMRSWLDTAALAGADDTDDQQEET